MWWMLACEGTTGKESVEIVATDSAETNTRDSEDSAQPATSLKIAVPAYFYPDSGKKASLWDAATAGSSLLIANPNSGPGGKIDSTYASAITSSQASGVKVIGYVSTRYGKRPQAEVTGEITQWFDWYGVDGIFLDEGPDQVDCLSVYDLYESYALTSRTKNPKALVAINPGTDTCASYLDFADILLIFEDKPEAFVGWRPPDWAKKVDPEHLWVLIHSEAGAESMQEELRTIAESGMGWVYVTDDVLPNPWDTLPAYWEAEVTGVQQ